MTFKNWKLWQRLALFFVPLALIPLGLILKDFFLEWFPKIIPPCFSYQYFGIYCMGCGGTRSFLALLSLDYITALRQNLLVPVLLLIWLLFEIQLGSTFFKKELHTLPTSKTFWMVFAFATLFYSVIRKIFRCIFEN